MRKVIRYVIVAIMSLSSMALGFAEPQRTLTLATVENLPPFSFYEGSELKGMDIEVIKEIAKSLNINIKIVPLPWARVIAGLQTGAIDGAFSVYENEERKSFCEYIGTVHYDNLGLVVKRGKEFTYSNTANLYGKRIGKGAGVFINTDFEAAMKEKKIIVEEINDTTMGNIKKLYVNRLDAVVGVVETMLYYSNALGYRDQIVSVKNYIDKNRPGYLVLSKKSLAVKDEKFKAELAKKISAIMNDGKYDGIRKKYMDLYGK